MITQNLNQKMDNNLNLFKLKFETAFKSKYMDRFEEVKVSMQKEMQMQYQTLQFAKENQ